ncbi:hypothetical protein AMTRI_Chr11g153520 [Amborella trichopoda]
MMTTSHQKNQTSNCTMLIPRKSRGSTEPKRTSTRCLNLWDCTVIGESDIKDFLKSNSTTDFQERGKGPRQVCNLSFRVRYEEDRNSSYNPFLGSPCLCCSLKHLATPSPAMKRIV